MNKFIHRLFSAFAIALAISSYSTNAQTDERIRLTDEELLKPLPENIIKLTPIPVAFEKGTLVYKQGGKYYAYDLKKGSTKECPEKNVYKSAEMPELVENWTNPTYSPDSTKIAYTLDNDLYSIDVRTKEITRHTFDGSDVILNGYASWVYYEEIFGRPSKYKAFWWSPDSRIIAYYRFDNTKVPMFPIYNSEGKHGSLNRTRYPKAGDINPTVKVGFVSADGGETVFADFDPMKDQYFGTPFWSGDGRRLMVSWMDRSQDDLDLYSVDPYDGRIVKVYKEHQKCWIDWMEEMLFTPQGIYMVRDYTGWQQIYFLSYNGSKYKQMTSGKNWSINLLKVDKKYLFYSAKCESTTRVDIYRITLSSGRVDRVSYGDFSFNNILISDDDSHIAAIASNSSTPFQLVDIHIPAVGGPNGKKVSVVFDTKGEDFDRYALAIPQLMTLTMRDGVEIPASVILPVDMDTTKKYPVKVNIYGGPDSPQVRDRWAVLANQWWANHGVIQITLDNRIGGHLGKAGMEQAYRRLSTVEFEDYIDGIKYFLSLPYVNKEKVGVEGFSFGGTMTTLCVTEGNEWFKYGIAGGGVYDWSLYDSHYTERYMDRPQDNEEGYAVSRVIDRIGKYKGDESNMLRITHGTGDDNVHFQNTLQLISALEDQCKDFELSIYPQGMHGYRKKQALHSQMMDYKFWYKYLLESEMPDVLKKYYENAH